MEVHFIAKLNILQGKGLNMVSQEIQNILDLADKLDNKPDASHEDPKTQELDKNLARFKFLSMDDLEERIPDEYKGDLKFDEEAECYIYKNRIVVIQPWVFDILDAEFDDLPNSTGIGKMYSYISTRYVGISWGQTRKYLASSDDHSRWRQRRKSQVTSVRVPSGPGREIGIDVTFLPRGMTYKYLVVVIDYFSKYIWAELTNTQDMTAQTEVFKKMVESMESPPKYLRADNAYRAEVFTDYLETIGCKPRFGTPSNPLGQATSEIANRTVKTLFLSYLDQDRNRRTGIKPALERVLRLYNRTISTSTGFRPSNLIDPKCPKKVLEEAKDNLKGNASGRDVNAKYNFPLLKGDKVKIDVIALDNNIRALKKKGQYKSSHGQTFSDKDYTVNVVRRDGLISVEEIPSRVFLRGQLLFIVPVKDDEFRRKYVTQWNGDRAADGQPVGREDYNLRHNF